jgi:hypothetical protein
LVRAETDRFSGFHVRTLANNPKTLSGYLVEALQAASKVAPPGRPARNSSAISRASG